MTRPSCLGFRVASQGNRVTMANLHTAKQFRFPWSPTRKRQRAYETHAKPKLAFNAHHTAYNALHTTPLPECAALGFLIKTTDQAPSTVAAAARATSTGQMVAAQRDRNVYSHAGAHMCLDYAADGATITPVAPSIGPFASACRAGSAERRGMATLPCDSCLSRWRMQTVGACIDDGLPKMPSPMAIRLRKTNNARDRCQGTPRRTNNRAHTPKQGHKTSHFASTPFFSSTDMAPKPHIACASKRSSGHMKMRCMMKRAVAQFPAYASGAMQDWSSNTPQPAGHGKRKSRTQLYRSAHDNDRGEIE